MNRKPTPIDYVFASFAIMLAFVLLVIMCGCSHNINTLSAGNWVKVGAGDYTLLTTGRGLQFTGVSRENSSATIIVNNETGVEVDPQTGSIKGIEEIYVEAGPQVTGYLVDLGKVCPDAVDKYMESLVYYWKYMLEKAKSKQPEPEPEPQPDPPVNPDTEQEEESGGIDSWEDPAK